MFTYNKKEFNVPIKIWMDKDEYYNDKDLVEQVENSAKLPFSFKHVALSPDGHFGYGAPIGGILATKNVIIPNFVGKDIGCGMCAVKTSLTDIDTDTLKKIMGEIRKVVPVGFNKHKEVQEDKLMPANFPYKILENDIVNEEYVNARKSLGTLGGGNHFIEIQKGDDGHIWIMIHSGSRNLGLQVANHYNKLAEEMNNKWYSETGKELAFLPTNSEEGKAYIKEMQYCVDFALANRRLMMERVKIAVTKMVNSYCVGQSKPVFDEMINIAHNYARQESHFGELVWVHRKGATASDLETIGIIPGSQGTKSYIVKGKGNPDSFNSCSHGAGRVMGRKQAIKELDLQSEIDILDKAGVIHSMRNKNDLDESVSCYKDIDVVMKNQEDLVDVLVELKPLGVIKA